MRAPKPERKPTRKHFSGRTRMKAVRMVVNIGRSHRAAAESVRLWVKAYLAKKREPTPKKKRPFAADFAS